MLSTVNGMLYPVKIADGLITQIGVDTVEARGVEGGGALHREIPGGDTRPFFRKTRYASVCRSLLPVYEVSFDTCARLGMPVAAGLFYHSFLPLF